VPDDPLAMPRRDELLDTVVCYNGAMGEDTVICRRRFQFRLRTLLR
jgi:hypothetical protein